MQKASRLVLLIAGSVTAAIIIAAVFYPLAIKQTKMTPRQEALNPPPAPIHSSVIRNIPHPTPRALPPTDLPLSLILKDLTERAASGEAGAACRLAAEYSYCSQIPARRADLDHWLSERQRAIETLPSTELKLRAGKQFEHELAFRESRVQELERHCDGVEIPDFGSVSALWRSAALAGSPSAMKQYASGNAFRWGNIIESIPLLTLYQGEAERIALVSAQRGDLDVLLSLASAYAPRSMESRSLLAQTIEPDPAKALAIYRHINATLRNGEYDNAPVAQEVGQRIDALERSLSAKDVLDVEAYAAEIARSWTSPQVRGVDRLSVYGRQIDVDRAWCER